MLDQVEAAMSLWDRFKKWHSEKRDSACESVAERFYSVFETHGVHRNQIPRFFGHGLTLEDVQTNVSLLPKLTEAVLEAVCDSFSIRREWLDGADKQAHPTHNFYKHPEDFRRFIINLKATNPEGELIGIVVSPSAEDMSTSALMILEERIGWISQKPIFRYHLCDNWPFSYWKARAYLTACIAIAWKNKIYIRGSKADSKVIARFAEGKSLMGRDSGALGALGHRQWEPENMALWPERFLLGIDQERDNFGIRSALKLWLELQQDGFMDTGLPMYEPEEVKKLFESSLAKFGEMA